MRKRPRASIPASASTPVFAAPPLLNETLKRGEIPAALNFWQYNARLDSDKFVELIKVEDMLPAVGLPADMPLLGWVFSDALGQGQSGRAQRLSRRRRRTRASSSPIRPPNGRRSAR